MSYSQEARELNKACRYSDCTQSTTLQYRPAVLRLSTTVSSRFATLTMPLGHKPVPDGAFPASSKHSDRVAYPWICCPGPSTLSNLSCSSVSYLVSPVPTHFSGRFFRLPGPSRACPPIFIHIPSLTESSVLSKPCVTNERISCSMGVARTLIIRASKRSGSGDGLENSLVPSRYLYKALFLTLAALYTRSLCRSHNC